MHIASKIVRNIYKFGFYYAKRFAMTENRVKNSLKIHLSKWVNGKNSNRG